MRHFTRDKSLTSSSPPMCAAIYGQHHSGGFLAYRQSKDFFRGFCCLPRFRSCPNPFPLRPFQAVFLVCSFLSPTAPTRQGHCYAVPLRIRFRKKFCLAAAVSVAFPPAKGRVKKRQGFLALIDQPARNMRQDRSIWRLTVIERRAFPLLRKKHRKRLQLAVTWRARHDSNVRPTESESVALSSWATGTRLNYYSIFRRRCKWLSLIFPRRSAGGRHPQALQQGERSRPPPGEVSPLSAR